MTDLERVRNLLGVHSRAWGDTTYTAAYTDCLDIIDAHLKADAADHQKMREDQNELARLREDMKADRSVLRRQAAELARLREWQEKANLALRDRDVENARLRDVVESYVTSGPTNQELRDLYIEEHNENSRLRERVKELEAYASTMRGSDV